MLRGISDTVLEPYQEDPRGLLRCWRCPECGHWAGSSYLHPPESNPSWRPRCKMKPPVYCSRPLMEPLYVEIIQLGEFDASAD